MSSSNAKSLTDADDLIILLWGLCGVGKSNLIKQCGATFEGIDANGKRYVRTPEVGQGVRPTTQDVVPYTFTHTFSGRTRRVTLVDVPGLDDEAHKAGEIFEQVTLWLWVAYESKGFKPFISAVIYVHLMTQVMGQSQIHCRTLLEHMCGAAAKKQLCILSTKAEGDDEVKMTLSIYREKEFSDYSDRIIRKESKRDQAAGIQCFESLWDFEPVPLGLLTEMVEGKALFETAAGRYLKRDMLDPTLAKLEQERASLPSGSSKRKETEDKISKKKKEVTRLSRIDKKALLKTTSKWSHRTAMTVAGVGTPFLITPLAVHVGLPILTAAGLLELVALGMSLGANAVESRDQRRASMKSQSN